LATPVWTDRVFEQLAQQLGQVDPSMTGGLSVGDCGELAAIAGRLLRGEPLQTRGMVQRLMFGASLPDLLARSLLESLDLPQDQSRVAAARALQASGIALCRQVGLPLADCPCFQEPAGIEFEDVLFLLFRLALGHWAGLFIPFHPLASI
jgi:hypothetical protein